ncbi:MULTISPECIES: nucleotidyltransferase family protein [Shewanella]|uniref:nucleotidyltransferase family protein n=1 Tax=Shewanella TaxID=22 RepID=UPI001BBA0090|nr:MULTISPECIES: nucleotidyltransferase family protein [Shewanella]GIU53577.1 xanthine dehydrogenase [Shewanella sp. KT0246]
MTFLSKAPKVISVMLAAGQSTRFDGAKLAATVSGPEVKDPDPQAENHSLLTHSLLELTQAAEQIDIGKPCVILGGHIDELSPLVPMNTPILINQDWQSGIASSVDMAAKYAQAEKADALLLSLADQVAISHLHYLSLYRLFCLFGQTTAAYYQQNPGVPAIFLAEDFDALQQLTGDSGAKKLLKQHLTNQTLAVFPLEQAAIDIDTKADLSWWLANKE